MGEYASSETLEEGEIVDDDNFEDISDSSMITDSMGKFFSPYQRLRALSLSGVSDGEVSTMNVKKRRKRRRTLKHCKKRKPKPPSDSSDNDNYVNKELKGKLKEAIRIDEVEDLHRNSLQTRLRGMGKGKEGESGGSAKEQEVESGGSAKEQEVEVASNDVNGAKQCVVNSKIDDPELENLRLEALKTAVINKSKKRKRRKALQNGLDVSQVLNDKENDTEKFLIKETIDDVTIKKPCLEQNDSSAKAPSAGAGAPPDLDDDEDVLRASLLAGLAKKITNTKIPEQPVKVAQFPKTPPKRPPLPIRILPKIPAASKLVLNNLKKDTKKVPIIRKIPLVKPLIINVNADSDSEDDQQMAQNVDVANAKQSADIDKFLKEQREKLEQETKRKKLEKSQKVLEKSAVKLLPKSKQIEYQQLVRQLKNAEKKRILKRLAPRPKPKPAVPVMAPNKPVVARDPVDSVNVKNHVAPAIKVSIPPLVSPVKPHCEPVAEIVADPTGQVGCQKAASEARNEVASITTPEPTQLTLENCDQVCRIVELEKKNSGVIKVLTTLQKTLKEIRTPRNGSLQVISKYQVLTPIMKKITEASNERKRHETHIRNLLRDLNEARSYLSRSHETFSTLVRELVDRKATIDQSSESQHAFSMEKCKETVDSEVIVAKANISLIHGDKGCKTAAPVTSTPVRVNENLLPFEESAILGAISDKNSNCEDMELCSNEEETFIDIVDPNDIDQIYKSRPVISCNIPEYASPLDNCGRYKNVDPLGIMCPFEVDGSCRDFGCTFKHYLNQQEGP